MDNDYSAPYNSFPFRHKPNKDYSAGKPSSHQAARRKARRRIEDLLEEKRIKQDHSL